MRILCNINKHHFQSLIVLQIFSLIQNFYSAQTSHSFFWIYYENWNFMTFFEYNWRRNEEIAFVCVRVCVDYASTPGAAMRKGTVLFCKRDLQQLGLRARTQIPCSCAAVCCSLILCCSVLQCLAVWFCVVACCSGFFVQGCKRLGRYHLCMINLCVSIHSFALCFVYLCICVPRPPTPLNCLLCMYTHTHTCLWQGMPLGRICFVCSYVHTNAKHVCTQVRQHEYSIQNRVASFAKRDNVLMF